MTSLRQIGYFSCSGPPMMPRQDLAHNVRGWTRFVPTRSVLPSIREGPTPIARGIVSNISESGARLVTNTLVDCGKRVELKLRLKADTLIETPARVVWCTESVEPSMKIVGALQGVQFLHPALDTRQELRRVLVPPDFRDVWRPKNWSPVDGKAEAALMEADIERLFANLEPVFEDEFEQLQYELLRDFEKLWARLRKP